MIYRMKKLYACSLTILLLAVQACCAIPIPVPEKEMLSGTEMQGKDVVFIKSGITSRGEIVEKLGKPYAIIEELRIIAYKWEMLSGYMPWFIAGGYSGVGGVLTRGSNKVLFVAFDENDRVTRFEIITQSDIDS